MKPPAHWVVRGDPWVPISTLHWSQAWWCCANSLSGVETDFSPRFSSITLRFYYETLQRTMLSSTKKTREKSANHPNNECSIYLCDTISGPMDRASTTKTIDLSLIPGRVKPKTIKIGIHSLMKKDSVKPPPCVVDRRQLDSKTEKVPFAVSWQRQLDE